MVEKDEVAAERDLSLSGRACHLLIAPILKHFGKSPLT